MKCATAAPGEFTEPDGGKTAHYVVGYPSTRAEAGPRSEKVGS